MTVSPSATLVRPAGEAIAAVDSGGDAKLTVAQATCRHHPTRCSSCCRHTLTTMSWPVRATQVACPALWPNMTDITRSQHGSASGKCDADCAYIFNTWCPAISCRCCHTAAESASTLPNPADNQRRVQTHYLQL